MELDEAYRILGVRPTASPEKVKRKFRELAHKHHPDRFSNAPPIKQQAAEEQFKKLNEAHQLIIANIAEKPAGFNFDELDVDPIDHIPQKKTKQPDSVEDATGKFMASEYSRVTRSRENAGFFFTAAAFGVIVFIWSMDSTEWSSVFFTMGGYVGIVALIWSLRRFF